MHITLYVKSRRQRETYTRGYTSQTFLLLRTLSMCPLSTTIFEFEVMKGFDDLIHWLLQKLVNGILRLWSKIEHGNPKAVNKPDT